MMSYGMVYPFGQLWSTVLAVFPPIFLYIPSPPSGAAAHEAENALMLGKPCSAITDLYYSQFSAQIQNLLPYSYYGEN